MITVKWLRDQLAEMNGDAAVTISVNGTLFDVTSLGTDNHDRQPLPRVVLGLGNGYRYRHRVEGK